MKKLRLRQEVKDVLGIILFYIVLIIGIVLMSGNVG